MTDEEKKQTPIYATAPEDIIIPEKRQRRGYDPAELRRLEQSITKLGQLQPGVCRKDGDTIVLVAGFRRLTACRNLSISFKYILKEEIVDPIIREEMELHENLMRENLSFLDQAAAHSRLHKLYMQTRGKGSIKGQSSWSLKKTAQELQISAATLHNNIELNEFAQTIPAVRDAKSPTEARKVVKRLKNQVLQQEALKQIRAKAESSNGPTAIGTAPAITDNLAIVEQQLAQAAKVFTSYVHTGDFREVLPKICEKESFDVVFFDPPWGVDFNLVFKQSGDRKTYTDDKKTFFHSLHGWLSTIYDYMKPDSHLYLKFGIVHHFWVVRMLQRAGFTTNGIPIIWQKLGAHRTRTPERWPGRCYEPIMLAHKGNKPLQQLGKPDIIQTPAPTPTMKDLHPSTMHPTLPRELFQRSCFPGDKILDPMAGSGMSGVAAESLREELQLSYTLIDQDEHYCNLMVKNLLRGYAKIISTVDQSKPQNTDYKSIKPGSPEWIKIWTNHPELQDEMMAWTKEQSAD